MIENFFVPMDFNIDWVLFHGLDNKIKFVWLFLYTQRGLKTNITAISDILAMDEETVKNGVLTVFAIKGGLEC